MEYSTETFEVLKHRKRLRVTWCRKDSTETFEVLKQR